MAIFEDAIILLVLLFFSGVFSGMETALVSLSKYRIKILLKKGARGAGSLEKLKKKPQRMITTILIGNNLVNIGAASFATVVAIQLFGDGAIGVATGIMTLLVLIFGEITPKTLALRHAEGISLAVAGPLLWLSYILGPVIFVLEKITKLIVMVFGVSSIEKGLTEDEVKAMVSMGAEEGAINRAERDIIHRVFRFNDIPVEDVMTSRTEMVAVPHNSNVSDILKVFEKSPFSRIPVYRESEDNIVGIFYVKDALLRMSKGKGDLKVEKIMRTAYFIPPTKTLEKLLGEFRHKHIHIAIVAGEYGEVLGLVTIEDLLEELVGDIVDELEAEPKIQRLNEKTIRVPGNMELELINKELGTKLSSDEFDTIAGLIMAKLDRVPESGEAIILEKIRIETEKVEGAKISSVKIVKL